MAIANGFGEIIRGKVGDKIYRRYNGRTIVSAAPLETKKSYSPKAIELREKFLFCTKFSKAVRDIPIFNDLWKKAAGKGHSPSNLLLKTNYPFLTPDFSLMNFCLVPPKLQTFDAVEKEIVFHEDHLSASFNPIGNGFLINYTKEIYISAQGTLLLFDPDKSEGKKFLIYPIISADENLSAGAELNFILPFSGVAIINMNKFPEKSVLINLVTKDKFRTTVRISLNFLT